MVLVTPTVALARSLARSVGRFMTRAFISLPVRKRLRLIPFTLHTHARTDTDTSINDRGAK